MSKGVKKALGFVVAIAIPFVAPMIAGAIAGAGLAGFGGWLGSAAVGAGLGAANAAVFTGGNIAQGALFGGLGAGLNAGMLQGMPMIGTTPANAAAGVPGFVDASAAAYPAGTVALPAGAPVVTPGVDIAAAGGAAYPTLPAAGAATPTQLTFMEAVGRIPGEFAKSLTDPTKLADFTLKAASMLTAGIMTEDPTAGMTDEEKQQIEALKQELIQKQQTDTVLFNRQLTLANDVMNEAKSYNPQYFAQQNANQQMLRDAAARQEIESRNRGEGSQGSDAARNAEVRRTNIAAGRNQSSAYGSGLQSALINKSQKLQYASGLFPTNVPSGAQSEIRKINAGLRTQSDNNRTGIQNTFTDFATRLLTPTANMPTSVGNKGGKP